MKIYQFGLFFAALIIVTGCTVSTPSAKVKAELPGVEVEVGGGNGKGCPPGLAKQGRC